MRFLWDPKFEGDGPINLAEKISRQAVIQAIASLYPAALSQNYCGNWGKNRDRALRLEKHEFGQISNGVPKRTVFVKEINAEREQFYREIFLKKFILWELPRSVTVSWLCITFLTPVTTSA